MSILSDGKKELDRLAPDTSGMHTVMGWCFASWFAFSMICLLGFWITGYQHFITAIIAPAIPAIACGFWWVMLLLIFASDV